MDLWDVDAVQQELFARAGLDPDEGVSPVAIARGLGIEVRVVSHPKFPGDGALVRLHDQWIAFVRGGISRERKRFALAHEIAEWALRGVVDERIEDACNAIAAALLAPRRAFVRRAREVGDVAFEQLALPFEISQTAAALRTGELQRVDLAVIRPGLVRTRGERLREVPQADLIRWSRGNVPNGVAKVKLTDDPRRTVLLVEDLEDVG